MPAPYTGGCACGQVRYRLDADPFTLYACHCTYCQAQSGSAFTLSMPLRRAAVVVTSGAVARWEFVAPDGRRHAGARCGVCPTRLWGEPERLPDVLVLRPGTLDDRSWVRPIAHIWTSRAQPWISIPDDVLAFPEQPDDERVLVRAWRTRR
jgi:hypothetical protein